MGLTREQARFRNEQLLRNLRYRWQSELSHLSDKQLVSLYDDFAISELYGNNDEHFLQYVRDCQD